MLCPLLDVLSEAMAAGWAEATGGYQRRGEEERKGEGLVCGRDGGD
jgi:hypothetical protein